MWGPLLVAVFAATTPGPRVLWSAPGVVQVEVVADTSAILEAVQAGIPWSGTPVLVATSGPARLQWVSAEPPLRLAIPCSLAAEPAPVACIDGEGYFRTQHVTRVLVQPLQLSRSGWILHRRVIVTVSFPPSRAPVRDPLVERLLPRLVVNNVPIGGPPPSPPRDLTPPPSPSCKLVVDHPGLYVVAYEDLAQAGVHVFGPVSSLRLWYHGLEQAFAVQDDGDGRFGPGDAIVFFGQERFRDDPAGREVPYVSQYGREATYWLSWAGGPGLRWRTVDASVLPGDHLAPWYWEWVHAEQENLIFIGNHNEPYNNEIEWYWQHLPASTTLFQFAIPSDAVAPADTFVLRVGLQGGSTGVGHHSQFFVTGTMVAESWWGMTSGREALVFDSADSGLGLPVSLLRTPSTAVGIKELPDGPSGAAAYSYLNWIELRYPRRYVARQGFLACGGPRGSSGQRHRFAVSGIQDSNVRIVNVTRGEWLVGASCLGDSLVFSAQVNEGDVLVIQHEAVPSSVRSIVPFAPPNPPLDSPSRAADYVVVTHETLAPAAATLASTAESEGLRAEVVSVGDLYDWFSWGEVHPTAIRDFLVFAYETWEPPALSMAVLLGDATWDFLGVTSPTQPNLVPTWGNPGNDFYFARLTHTGGSYDWVPDIALGRLPARTLQEATRMVALAREGSVSKRLLMVAHGSSDTENATFAMLSNSLLAQGVPAEMLAVHDTVYADPIGTPGPRSYRDDFVSAWKRGPLMVHFLGRGDFFTWSMELHTTMADTLTGADPRPFLIGGSCHSGRFAMPDSSCLGEAMLRATAQGAGVTGVISSTGITSLSQAYLWSWCALPVLLSRLGHTVGEGYLAGVLASGDFLAQRYVLLGDPRLRLARPSMPDLTAPDDWLRVPLAPLVGEQVMLTARFVNDGCAPMGAPQTCHVTLVDSSAFGEGPVASFELRLPSQRDTSLTVPWTPLTRGTHRIKARIDPDNLVTEANEANNDVSVDIEVTSPAPVPFAPLDCELLRRPPQLVVSTLPDEPEMGYRFQVASHPRFRSNDLVFDSGLVPAGDYYTAMTLPPLPERVALFWRCRAEDAVGASRWSTTWSFEIDRTAPAGGWRQRHWGQFASDSLFQCRVDSVASGVVLSWDVGPDVALTDSGASVVSVSSSHPSFSPAAMLGPGFFIFGYDDPDQTAVIDLGSVRTVAAVGAEVWSGPMDRGVWSRLELSLSLDGATYTPCVSYGPYPIPTLDIPARVLVGVDPPTPARYIRARFGAGCPHPEALWGSRVYELAAFPRVGPGEGVLRSGPIGPATSWIACSVEAQTPSPGSILVSVQGYSIQDLSWQPLPGLDGLPAPGTWSLSGLNADLYPWVRLEARVWGAEDEPRLTAWDVLFAPR